MADDASAPIGTPPAPAPAAPPPGPPPAAAPPAADAAPAIVGADSQTMSDAATAMNDGDAGTFLRTFLETEGVALSDLGLSPDGVTPLPATNGASPPPAQPPGTPPVGTPPVTAPQPPGNGGPPPPNGDPAPPAPTAVDPNLVARLWSTAPPAMPSPAPWPPAPPAVAPAPQPAPAAPGGQPPTDPLAAPQLFNEPFQLPPELAAALNHDDPNVRATAVGAAMAAAANTTVGRYHEHFVKNVIPLIQQRSVGEFQQINFKETQQRELYGPFPHLRYASPDLLQRAASIVVQDELARNPAAANGPISREVWQKIGQLASEGLRQMAGGALPTFAPPAPGGAPPAPPSPYPGWAWNGAQWVPAAPPHSGFAPPSPTPWVAGQNGQPFGMPPGANATPDSEYASFFGPNGWGGV